MCMPNNGNSNTAKMEPIPFVLRPWLFLYRATPRLRLPGTDVNFGFALLCAVAFSVLRLSFRLLLYSLGWPVGSLDTYFASACMASFCHSSLILPGLGATLLSQKYVPSGRLEPSPKWYKDATCSLMMFCTGYMIYDSVLGYIVETWQIGVGPVLTADDWTYVGHHIMTSLYMISSLWNGAGHMSAMMLIFNGEFSAPLMNPHLFMEKALDQDCWKGIEWLPKAFAYNEQLFSLIYLVCRVVVSPFVISYVSYDLLLTKRGRKDVPLWLSILWMPMCWGVQLGSIPWIMTCFDTLKRGPAVGAMHEEL
ncbi:hypothetical protein ACHAWF_010297 [Thalassiosira exigua]